MTTLIELNTGVEYLKTNLKYDGKSKSTSDLDHFSETGSIRLKKNVKFESSIFLDDLFKKALKFCLNQSLNTRPDFDGLKLSIGIDIVCYGAYNAKMAYVLTKDNGTFHSIDTFDHHIGNLKIKSRYTESEIEFIDEFQLLINKMFQLFGKRWHELTDSDKKVSRSCSFKIVERDQLPHIWYDDSKCYSINVILCKFFSTMFKCLGLDLSNKEQINRKFLNLCVTLPSDFHSYQRLTLKNCFEQIGLANKFLLVNKSTSLALPFLTKHLNDSTKKFILDFGSGYMNCSILQRIKRTQVDVTDQLADRSISSKSFFEECYEKLKHEAKSQGIKLKKTKARYDLYKAMNTETNLTNETLKEKWTIPTHGHNIELNMKRIGVEQLASSIIEKLKRTNIINKKTHKIVDEIKDVLICSDAILYEYLEPLVRFHCAKGTRITFMDNDCASLGAAFLASSTLKINTYDMLPYPIGFGLYNGVIKSIIDSKTNFPCTGKHTFQTLIDNQTTIRINLYEGESPLARNCKHICELVIDNLRQGPAGSIKIEVKIGFDQNGVLSAHARDIDKNNDLPIVVNFNSLNSFEFKRNKHEKRINIHDKLDPKVIVKDQDLAKKLQDFDYYFDYLMNIYKNSPLSIKCLMSKKILIAKKYISKNRLRIGFDDLSQLRTELEELLNKYRPSYSENHSKFSIRQTIKSSLCSIL